MRICIEVNKMNFEKLVRQYREEHGETLEEARKSAKLYCQAVVRDVAFAGL